MDNWRSICGNNVVNMKNKTCTPLLNREPPIPNFTKIDGNDFYIPTWFNHELTIKTTSTCNKLGNIQKRNVAEMIQNLITSYQCQKKILIELSRKKSIKTFLPFKSQFGRPLMYIEANLQTKHIMERSHDNVIIETTLDQALDDCDNCIQDYTKGLKSILSETNGISAAKQSENTDTPTITEEYLLKTWQNMMKEQERNTIPDEYWIQQYSLSETSSSDYETEDSEFTDETGQECVEYMAETTSTKSKRCQFADHIVFFWFEEDEPDLTKSESKVKFSKMVRTIIYNFDYDDNNNLKYRISDVKRYLKFHNKLIDLNKIQEFVPKKKFANEQISEMSPSDANQNTGQSLCINENEVEFPKFKINFSSSESAVSHTGNLTSEPSSFIANTFRRLYLENFAKIQSNSTKSLFTFSNSTEYDKKVRTVNEIECDLFQNMTENIETRVSEYNGFSQAKSDVIDNNKPTFENCYNSENPFNYIPINFITDQTGNGMYLYYPSAISNVSDNQILTENNYSDNNPYNFYRTEFGKTTSSNLTDNNFKNCGQELTLDSELNKIDKNSLLTIEPIEWFSQTENSLNTNSTFPNFSNNEQYEGILHLDVSPKRKEHKSKNIRDVFVSDQNASNIGGSSNERLLSISIETNNNHSNFNEPERSELEIPILSIYTSSLNDVHGLKQPQLDKTKVNENNTNQVSKANKYSTDSEKYTVNATEIVITSPNRAETSILKMTDSNGVKSELNHLENFYPQSANLPDQEEVIVKTKNDINFSQVHIIPDNKQLQLMKDSHLPQKIQIQFGTVNFEEVIQGAEKVIKVENIQPENWREKSLRTCCGSGNQNNPQNTLESSKSDVNMIPNWRGNCESGNQDNPPNPIQKTSESSKSDVNMIPNWRENEQNLKKSCLRNINQDDNLSIQCERKKRVTFQTEKTYENWREKENIELQQTNFIVSNRSNEKSVVTDLNVNKSAINVNENWRSKMRQETTFYSENVSQYSESFATNNPALINAASEVNATDITSSNIKNPIHRTILKTQAQNSHTLNEADLYSSKVKKNIAYCPVRILRRTDPSSQKYLPIKSKSAIHDDKCRNLSPVVNSEQNVEVIQKDVPEFITQKTNNFKIANKNNAYLKDMTKNQTRRQDILFLNYIQNNLKSINGYKPSEKITLPRDNTIQNKIYQNQTNSKSKCQSNQKISSDTVDNLFKKEQKDLEIHEIYSQYCAKTVSKNQKNVSENQNGNLAPNTTKLSKEFEQRDAFTNSIKTSSHIQTNNDSIRPSRKILEKKSISWAEEVDLEFPVNKVARTSFENNPKTIPQNTLLNEPNVTKSLDTTHGFVQQKMIFHKSQANKTTRKENQTEKTTNHILKSERSQNKYNKSISIEKTANQILKSEGPKNKFDTTNCTNQEIQTIISCSIEKTANHTLKSERSQTKFNTISSTEQGKQEIEHNSKCSSEERSMETNLTIVDQLNKKIRPSQTNKNVKSKSVERNISKTSTKILKNKLPRAQNSKKPQKSQAQCSKNSTIKSDETINNEVSEANLKNKQDNKPVNMQFEEKSKSAEELHTKSKLKQIHKALQSLETISEKLTPANNISKLSSQKLPSSITNNKLVFNSKTVFIDQDDSKEQNISKQLLEHPLQSSKDNELFICSNTISADQDPLKLQNISKQLSEHPLPSRKDNESLLCSETAPTDYDPQQSQTISKSSPVKSFILNEHNHSSKDDDFGVESEDMLTESQLDKIISSLESPPKKYEKNSESNSSLSNFVLSLVSEFVEKSLKLSDSKLRAVSPKTKNTKKKMKKTLSKEKPIQMKTKIILQKSTRQNKYGIKNKPHRTKNMQNKVECVNKIDENEISPDNKTKNGNENGTNDSTEQNKSERRQRSKRLSVRSNRIETRTKRNISKQQNIGKSNLNQNIEPEPCDIQEITETLNLHSMIKSLSEKKMPRKLKIEQYLIAGDNYETICLKLKIFQSKKKPTRRERKIISGLTSLKLTCEELSRQTGTPVNDIPMSVLKEYVKQNQNTQNSYTPELENHIRITLENIVKRQLTIQKLELYGVDQPTNGQILVYTSEQAIANDTDPIKISVSKTMTVAFKFKSIFKKYSSKNSTLLALLQYDFKPILNSSTVGYVHWELLFTQCLRMDNTKIFINSFKYDFQLKNMCLLYDMTALKSYIDDIHKEPAYPFSDASISYMIANICKRIVGTVLRMIKESLAIVVEDPNFELRLEQILESKCNKAIITFQSNSNCNSDMDDSDEDVIKSRWRQLKSLESETTVHSSNQSAAFHQDHNYTICMENPTKNISDSNSKDLSDYTESEDLNVRLIKAILNIESTNDSENLQDVELPELQLKKCNTSIEDNTLIDPKLNSSNNTLDSLNNAEHSYKVENMSLEDSNNIEYILLEDSDNIEYIILEDSNNVEDISLVESNNANDISSEVVPGPRQLNCVTFTHSDECANPETKLDIMPTKLNAHQKKRLFNLLTFHQKLSLMEKHLGLDKFETSS